MIVRWRQDDSRSCAPTRDADVSMKHVNLVQNFALPKGYYRGKLPDKEERP
jgi:hypothetical protein